MGDVDPISEDLADDLTLPELRRLVLAGYMSPHGGTEVEGPFSCAACDFVSGDTCKHPKVRSSIERGGCCNRFTYNGVGTEPKDSK